MTLLSILSLFILNYAHAAELPKLCYDTVDSTQFCTTDNLGKVQVFIYNAGWCPPCNEEMQELSPLYSQFSGKKVVFVSLSAEGYARGTKPDKVFLESWKLKHKIPFTVAGKYKDFGGAFGNRSSIPFAVIVDAKGNVALKGFVSVDAMVTKVNELLKEAESENILAKAFFEKIRGNYSVELVAGEPPHDPTQPASIYLDSEFPNLEMVYMPYCADNICMDSGNYFVYDNTLITKTEKGHHIVLKSEAKEFLYDWEDDGSGKIIYRNYQFKGQSPTPFVLEHVLKRAPESSRR